MSIKHTNPVYRGDIDGLRAIAVMLVIVFHAGIEWLPSGFIGVDIFFVISGYLITGIISTQIKEKRFSLSNFLTGRLWRIQPALLAVTIVTLIIASFLYVVQDYVIFLKSIKYSSLFISNQFFSKQSVTYASPESEFFPLLHTWSLSVEWQWYLFLPLILLSIAYLIRRSGVIAKNERSRARRTTWCWLAVTLILCCYSMLSGYRSQGQSYYSLMARAFEFTAGGSALFLNRLIVSPSRWLLSCISGTALIIVAIVAAKNGVLEGYPNYYTVAVVLSAAAVIFCGKYNEKIVSLSLSLTSLTYIGRLSYSLYLWHWPVFVFFRYKGIPLSGFMLVIALIAVAGFSTFSYHFIETPLRRKRMGLKSTVFFLVVLPIVVFSTFYSLSLKYDGLPQRLGDSYTHRQDVMAEYLNKSGNRSACLDEINDPLKCQLGAFKGDKTALMIGDSNSNHFWGFFDVLGKQANIKISALSVSSCLTLPGLWQYDWWIYKNSTYKDCHDKTQSYYNLIRQGHYDYVIIGEVWEQYANGPHLINNEGDARSDELSKVRMSKSARQAIDIVVGSGATPVFIKTINSMPAGYQECLNHVAIDRADFEHSSCNAPELRGEDGIYIKSLFSQLKSEYPSLVIIDPKDAQCQGGKCVSQIDGVPFYRDVGHLTDYASYKLGDIYLKRMGNPFVK